MANESITDDIVRDFFTSDELYMFDKVIIERQASSNPKIDKLLKNASKSGNGKGFPDFIIQYKENPSLVIVIECKAEKKFHKSETLDNYKDYAVDGVLLYSSFLCNEYDVISIAVSGTDKSNISVSHFMQLKSTTENYSIFNDDKLMSLSDYENVYKTDERKFNQDFQELLKHSKTLNDKFHSLKVKESERSLLISGTLIALTDKAFCNAYKHKKPESLAKYLVATIEEKLTDVQNLNIKDIITTFSFITTHSILSAKENELRDIIDEIDNKINNFVKTYKYFDTLGQFYIEFLRYANNDKGLGIVLTPPHITELFCEIANVNKDSVILDTCTGTGGFLISAMRKMIIDAGGDDKKINDIKSKQIVGIELQHDIFTLVCSNMYIHGDGRSNLIKGSCFDEKIIEQIKKFKPNVGFLNPPYKSSKTDTEELEFVVNNANQLEKGSYCIAIVPMSTTLTQSKNSNRLILKEKILKNHTLEAVFSMPNELFVNSEAGIVTSVIVLKVKEPHPKGYKTYFGYWKDDGFIKKRAGRSDYDNNWLKIREYWINSYRNKEEIECFSTKREVSYKDEWCAEAYLLTDYSSLTDNHFIKKIREYIGFKFSQGMISTATNECKQKLTLDFKTKQKAWFNIIKSEDNNGLFSYSVGCDTSNVINKLSEGEGTVFQVSNSSLNNGINNIFHGYNYNNKNTITLATRGNDFVSFYHEYDIIPVVRVINLKPINFELNKYIAMYLCTIFEQSMYRFSYGRVLSGNTIADEKILLPVASNGNPDWEFMENYIKSLPYSKNL